MASSQDDGRSYWGYLINQDKTAAPLFEQLCLGLSKIIRNFDQGRDKDLTPPRLAAFYRTVGGNYDELFLGTSDAGLSFLYRTLGCFHSLEPTDNPFETPCRPCLTDVGFVRWQTLQLLLCPAEHVGFVQRAVQLWNVPRPDGGSFPKNIPKECFPDKPDHDMERWHRFVTSQINQDNYMRRLKASPYQSPYPDSQDSPTGYFGRIPGAKRPSTGRRYSGEEEQARLLADRRRSSVPDMPVPIIVPVQGSDKDPKTRSHSAQRPGSGSRPRSATANSASIQSPTKHRSSHSLSANRHGSNTSVDRQNRPRSAKDRNRSQPSTDTSAEDASSEESYQGRRHRSKGDTSLKDRLWPPPFLSSHKRRHSSGPELRRRDDRSPRRESSQRQNQQHGQYLDPQRPSQPTVRFKNDVFTKTDSQSPIAEMAPLPPPPVTSPPTSYRYSVESGSSRNNGLPDPIYHPLSDLDIGKDHQSPRKAGLPVRVATVSGVNGRKYASAEPRSPGVPRDRNSRARNSAVPSMV